MRWLAWCLLLVVACARTNLVEADPGTLVDASSEDSSTSDAGVARCEVVGFGTPVTYVTDTSPGAVVTGDFTGDGRIDMIVDEGATQELFTNAGGGTFRRGALSASTANNYDRAVVGDFDRDGRLDIASQSDSLLGIDFGLPNGAFRSQLVTVATPQTNGVLATADFNGDGALDVAFAGVTTGPGPPGELSGPVPVDFGLSVYLNAGDGTLESPTSYATPSSISGLATGDFDGDGRVDIAASRGDAVVIYFNPGGGTFGDAQAVTGNDGSPLSFTVADFNADGLDDVAVLATGGGDAGGSSQILVFLSAGGGAFGPPTVDSLAHDPAPSEIVAGDYNGDGLPDLAMAFWGAELGGTIQPGPMAVYYNEGGGRFGGAVAYQVRDDVLSYVARFTSADLNGDSVADLAISTATEDYMAPDELVVLLTRCEQE